MYIVSIRVGFDSKRFIGPFQTENLARNWILANVDPRIFPWKIIELENPK